MKELPEDSRKSTETNFGENLTLGEDSMREFLVTASA